MSKPIYTKEDVEVLLAIALAARERMAQQTQCPHPEEWRTKTICGICLKDLEPQSGKGT